LHVCWDVSFTTDMWTSYSDNQNKFLKGCVIPMDVIVTEADSYSAIVGNDWLRKIKASFIITIKWEGNVLDTT
jgi:hypothetical protein